MVEEVYTDEEVASLLEMLVKGQASISRDLSADVGYSEYEVRGKGAFSGYRYVVTVNENDVGVYVKRLR